MTDEDSLSELLACPRCDRAPLDRRAPDWHCGGCKTEFPSVGGLPWLFAAPDASLGEWRNRLHFALQQLAHDASRLKTELAAGTGLPQTAERLTLQLAASEAQRRHLQKLLAPLDVQSMQSGYESHLALRTRLPTDQGLNTYYANMHRDWCWGDAENQASIAQIRAALAEGGGAGDALGDTLVLGAGACRLAYDLHQGLGTKRTVAVDFNPLLLFVANAVMRGEAVELYEFPIAPRTLADSAVLRRLAAPAPVRPHFHFVLADVLRPPFAAAAFDTVVTPWLIDIVSEDFPPFAARINRLLKAGGRWLNFGSLSFEQQPQRARRYSTEEIMALTEAAGFATPVTTEATIPYMCSPASRHGRQESVLTFAAVKERDAAAAARYKALPDWIVTGTEPVPLLPSFRTQAMSTQIYAFVMSLVDGRRSIADMAALMDRQKLMTRDEAVPAIRNFLTRMYDDSQRNAGF